MRATVAPAVDTKIEFCLATNLPTGSVTLDARGLSGSVYFVKLQVGRTIVSRSVVLVR